MQRSPEEPVTELLPRFLGVFLVFCVRRLPNVSPCVYLPVPPVPPVLSVLCLPAQAPLGENPPLVTGDRRVCYGNKLYAAVANQRILTLFCLYSVLTRA